MSITFMWFLHNIRTFVQKHTRHLPAVALALGLVWDSITLGRPDRLFDNVILLSYLVIAGAGIVFLNYHRQRTSEKVRLWQILLIQFSFGNLASALLILYSQSGTITGNWLFFLFLIALLVGNEFLRGRYERMLFHIGIYYLLVFSYLILIFPVLFKDIHSTIFLLSGAASIVFIILFLGLVSIFAPFLVVRSKKGIILTIGVIFMSFNLFYFLNLIPPVPLSLKEVGIYHSVERQESGEYRVSYEKGEWYEFWKHSDTAFHFTRGDSAHCFSSIFVPVGIKTNIFHRWEYYDETEGEWSLSTSVAFSVFGGREEGYRVFSSKSALFPGKWRCDVETERGALVGRENFKIISNGMQPELVRSER